MVRVLLIDDSPIFLEAIAEALTAFDGVNIVGACRGGRAGVAAARLAPPDLAIVDLRMPDLNGAETCRLLRAEFPHTTIVLVSLHAEGWPAARVADCGADAFVFKSELFTALPELLGRCSPESERRR